MSEALNKLAIQFAEANKQEQQWLKEELKDIRRLLVAIILQTKEIYNKDAQYRLYKNTYQCPKIMI